VASVKAIVSALNDGAGLVADCQEKWSQSQDKQQRKQQQQDEQKIITLQRTLSSGSTQIRECYDLYYRGKGQPFADGDSKSSWPAGLSTQITADE